MELDLIKQKNMKEKNQNVIPRKLSVRGLKNCRNFNKGWLSMYSGYFHYMCSINTRTWRMFMGWKAPAYKHKPITGFYPLRYKKEDLMIRLKREGKIK